MNRIIKINLLKEFNSWVPLLRMVVNGAYQTAFNHLNKIIGLDAFNPKIWAGANLDKPVRRNKNSSNMQIFCLNSQKLCSNTGNNLPKYYISLLNCCQ